MQPIGNVVVPDVASRIITGAKGAGQLCVIAFSVIYCTRLLNVRSVIDAKSLSDVQNLHASEYYI